MENAFDFYIIPIAQDITASYVSNGFYYFGNNKQEYHIVTPEKIVFFISKKAFLNSTSESNWKHIQIPVFDCVQVNENNFVCNRKFEFSLVCKYLPDRTEKVV